MMRAKALLLPASLLLGCAELDVAAGLEGMGYTVLSVSPAELSTIGPRRCPPGERAYRAGVRRYPVPGEPCLHVDMVLRVCVPDHESWTVIPLLSQCRTNTNRPGPWPGRKGGRSGIH